MSTPSWRTRSRPGCSAAVLVDPLTVTASVPASLLRAEEDLRGQMSRLREQLDASVRRLHVAPANVRRVVDTALAVASQPPLADMDAGGAGLVSPPDLRAGWERTVAGLADPLSGPPRPLTFDPHLAEDRDDVVLAHLEHPLVAQATRLLRSAIWGGRTPLHRLAAVRLTLPEEAAVDGVLVAVFARLVIVGADGGRLHEEVMLAARSAPGHGRSRRIELEQPRTPGCGKPWKPPWNPMHAASHPRQDGWALVGPLARAGAAARNRCPGPGRGTAGIAAEDPRPGGRRRRPAGPRPCSTSSGSPCRPRWKARDRFELPSMT